METPDCLFVRTKNNVLLDTSFFPTDGCITYINKETLLEWAKKMYQQEDRGSWYSRGKAKALEELIDKLNSM